MSGQEPTDRLLERGLQAARAGRAAEAQDLLRQVLQRDRRNAEAWYAMAWTMPTARAFAWCLEQALTVDPGHAEAAQFLNEARSAPEQFAARWLEGDLKRLDAALGRASAKIGDAERLADEVDRRLAALERQAEGRGESPGVGVAEPPLEGPGDRRRGAGPPAGEASAPRQPARGAKIRAGEGYPEGLHHELGLLWKSLVRQRRDLRRVERRVERAWDAISGAWAGRGAVTIGRQRVSIVALVLICLGILLLILGAIRAYPYLHSRLSSLMGAGGVAMVERLNLNKWSLDREGGGFIALAVEQPAGTGTPSPEASPTPPGATGRGAQPIPAVETEVAPAVKREFPADADGLWSFDWATSQLSALPSPTPRPTATALPTATPVDTATPSPTPRPTVPLPTTTPAPLPPTRIVISRLGVDAPVVPVSFQAAREEWEVPAQGAAGWHEGSAGLGVPGNTVFNGHNTTGGEVFRDLYRLERGDVITVYSNDVVFSYLVSEVLILPEVGQPQAVRERNAAYLLPTPDERLTLVTCHPYGSLRNRLMVIARPM